MVKYLIGMLFGVLTILTLAPIYKSIVGPKPYSQQENILIDWDDSRGELDIQSIFYKNGECDLETFAVVGISNGVARYIDYVDNDSIPENFNREEGWHLVNITVDISKDIYDTVELRVRHTCYGDPKLINNVYLGVYNGQQTRKES